MILQYMQQLEAWRNKYNEGQPLSQAKLSYFEEKYNIEFPKSYKEFLLISGKSCRVIIQGHYEEFIEEKQQRAQELLKEFKLNHLIKKTFWVIATDANAFWYFHFDEGDNPPLYRLDCEYYGDMDDKYTFGKVAESFQAWVEKKIDFYERDPENK